MVSTRRSNNESLNLFDADQTLTKCKTSKRTKARTKKMLHLSATRADPQTQQEEEGDEFQQRQQLTTPTTGNKVVPLDICSSPEETKPEVDILSWLEPVSKARCPIKGPRESLKKLVDAAVVFKDALVAYLEETAQNLDIADMVQNANECFTRLRGLEVDYRLFHGEVCTFIKNHLELKEATKEKNTLASRLRADYEDSMVNADDKKEVLLRAKNKLISAQTTNNLTAKKNKELTAILGRLKKVDAMERDGLAALTAGRDHCNETYLLAEKIVEETGARLEGINQRYDVAEQETQRSLGRLRELVGK
ncbi:uncharacterized protein LOC141693862 isoform X2 [Apium graveolens]|uniref:uncharacterized protein LOC141693862 isoform X2 n=1 Tax=Apium graveolens TaxID=4045 RepID=UPI003D7BA25A